MKRFSAVIAALATVIVVTLVAPLIANELGVAGALASHAEDVIILKV